MKRDPRLAGLSVEHHRALVLARRVESGSVAASDLRTHFERDLEPHFAIEERVLLPALRSGGHAAIADRTQGEHDRLRRAVEIANDGEPDTLRGFASLLVAHVRFEERELFPACEAHLPVAVLDEVSKHRPERRSMSSLAVLAGIFVGGSARRMGGKPKGLLETEAGETIVDRWIRIFAECNIPVVLVGDAAPYESRQIERVRDADMAVGPLAGLMALLERAGDGAAIAVACDMPYVSRTLVERLVTAPPTRVVAARREGRWEPFFARYDAARVLPVARKHAAAGAHAMQGLLEACGAQELSLDRDELRQLDDWDTPSDIRRGS